MISEFFAFFLHSWNLGFPRNAFSPNIIFSNAGRSIIHFQYFPIISKYILCKTSFSQFWKQPPPVKVFPSTRNNCNKDKSSHYYAFHIISIIIIFTYSLKWMSRNERNNLIPVSGKSKQANWPIPTSSYSKTNNCQLQSVSIRDNLWFDNNPQVGRSNNNSYYHFQL